MNIVDSLIVNLKKVQIIKGNEMLFLQYWLQKKKLRQILHSKLSSTLRKKSISQKFWR